MKTIEKLVNNITLYNLEIKTRKRWLKLMLPKDILNSGKLAVTAKIACRTGAIL